MSKIPAENSGLWCAWAHIQECIQTYTMHRAEKKNLNNDERKRKRWASLDVVWLAECFERRHKALGLVPSTM